MIYQHECLLVTPLSHKFYYGVGRQKNFSDSLRGNGNPEEIKLESRLTESYEQGKLQLSKYMRRDRTDMWRERITPANLPLLLVFQGEEPIPSLPALVAVVYQGEKEAFLRSELFHSLFQMADSQERSIHIRGALERLAIAPEYNRDFLEKRALMKNAVSLFDTMALFYEWAEGIQLPESMLDEVDRWNGLFPLHSPFEERWEWYKERFSLPTVECLNQRHALDEVENMKTYIEMEKKLANIRKKWGMTFEEGRLLEAAKKQALNYIRILSRQHEFPPELNWVSHDNLFDEVIREIEKRFQPSGQGNDPMRGVMKSFTDYMDMVKNNPPNE
ncbi:hypothetical protein HYV84_06725 [Candidatus Woesearchaeota archaeon]|nr:hypothetical protein [Candidatus Woesearchaeota archaeon]